MSASDCYETEHAGQAFLRLMNARERRALPYALLVDVELSENSTALKLVFPHYEVTVRGRNLEVIFEKIAAARCTLIQPGRSSRSRGQDSDEPTVVTEVRLKCLSASAQN
jgi:hypothetical protein